MKRSAAVLVLTLALGLGGLYVAAGEALFQADTYNVRDPGGLVLGLCVVFFLVRWIAPPTKITLLCRAQGIPLPYHIAFPVHFISVLGDALTPSHSGGGPAVAAALARLGVPLGRGLGLAMQLLILDLIYYSWSVPLCLGFLVLTGAIALPAGVEVAALAAFLVSLAGAVVLSRYPLPMSRLILASARLPFLSRFEGRVQQASRDYYSSAMAFLGMPGSTWVLLQLVTAVSWLGNYALLWSLMEVYGIDVGPVDSLAVLNLINLTSNFVPTPGGSGYIEAAVGLLLPGMAVGGALAAPILLWRVASFYIIFLVGPLAGWLLYLSSPVMKPPAGEEDDADPKPE